MQVKIDKIDIVEKMSGAGKRFKMFEIFTDKHGQTKLTKFVDKDDPFKYVRVGDTVEMIEKPNGRFMNFEYVVMKNNQSSASVITQERKPPFYEPPGALSPVSSIGNDPVETSKDKVDRNYELLLRIARHVGVELTNKEINDSLGF